MAVLQVEAHVFAQQTVMRETIAPYGTRLMAWGPLAQGADNLFKDETLRGIGAKYGKSNAQVALKFLTDEGIIAIPKSMHKERMKENFEIFDFELTEEDRRAIHRLDKQVESGPQRPCTGKVPFGLRQEFQSE